jgi:alpha-ribazole phosphatase
MIVIRFVRHAESQANAGGVTMPNAVIPLSLRGQAQAAQLPEALAVFPSQVLVSGFLRTHQTSAPFCAHRRILAQEHPLLHEFCTLDPALIAGLDAVGRRPIVEDYWARADPDIRMGAGEAESFHTFAGRVEAFLDQMHALEDGTLVFGHGMWLALLVWRVLGFRSQGSAAMRKFRQFQLALPMPNCAQYVFAREGSGHWSVRYDAVSLNVPVAGPLDASEPCGDA